MAVPGAGASIGDTYELGGKQYVITAVRGDGSYVSEQAAPGYSSNTGALTFGSADLNTTHSVDTAPTFGAIDASFAGQLLVVHNDSGAAMTFPNTNVTADKLTIEANQVVTATVIGTDSWLLAGGTS